jgi:streptogramin lyase
LWVANFAGNSVARYDKASLVSGGPRSALQLGGTSLDGPNDVRVDSLGWVWAVTYTTSALLGWSPADQVSGHAATVTVQPTAHPFKRPASIALDGRGGLWVGDEGTGDVHHFLLAALRRPGARPDVVLTLPAESCQGIAVDSRGWLWRACYAKDLLFGYPPTALRRSGSPRPGVSTQFPDGVRCGPTLLATAPGKLWITCYDDGSVVAAALPRPDLTRPLVRLTGDQLKAVHGIAAAPDGALWLGTSKQLILRVPGSALSSGEVDPDVVLHP